MIKLRDAKCPSCGANIQVNDKLENTICQYCGSQVIIEEAIEKYKLEISGKVEVDGIRGRNSKIEQARKHIKIAEYDEAKKILEEIIAEDSLDVESYIELLKVEIIKMRSEKFNEALPTNKNLKWQEKFTEIKQNYDRIKKLDDEKIADKELSDYQEELNKYLACLDKLNAYTDEYKKFNEEAIKRLNEYVNKALRISSGCAEGFEEAMSSIFHIGASIYPFFKQENAGYTKHADKYQVIKFTKFNLDGSLEGDYKKITDNDVFNDPRKSLIIHCVEPPADLKELKIRVNALLDSADEYLAEYATGRNNEIDKQNKKLDRKNTVINVKNNFIKVRIFIDFAIIAVLVLITLALLFSEGIGGAIAMGIFLDSWVIYLCVDKIGEHKQNLRENNMSKYENDRKKKEHV